MSTPFRLFRSTTPLLQAYKHSSSKKSPPKSKRKPSKPFFKKPPPEPKKYESLPNGSLTPGLCNGILRPVRISPELSLFLGGVLRTSRTVAAQKIWDHIKLNNLQDPANNWEITCDDKLKMIFNGRDRVGYLQVSKLLTPHFVNSN